MVLVFALAACTVPGTEVERGAETPQALLDALASAEQDGDTRTVRDLLAPDASNSFVSAELARAVNLRVVPFTTWRYRIDSGPDENGVVAATLEYAIEGGDVVPTRRQLRVDLDEHDSAWFVAGFDDVPGARSYRGPWDFGRVAATHAGERAIVIAHPAWERLSGDIARVLPAAADDVLAAVGGDWQRNVVVFLTASDGEFTALGGVVPNAASTVSDGDGAGQRIVMSPGTRSKLHRAALEVLIRHELVHVATRARTLPETPLWVTEGYADFVAFDPAEKVEPQSGGLPDNAAFAGRDANRAYATARSVFAYVDANCGERGAVRFYDALASGVPVGQATMDVCGAAEPDFVASWHEWTLHP